MIGPYKLKKELDEGYSIGIEDFEKFAKLINDFRNLDLDIPKIIEKYITAISIEDKIKEESQKLDRLKMQTIQLNDSLLNWQDEINQHKQYLDIYRQPLNRWDLASKKLNSCNILFWK